jgi:flagellar basal body-associated protein FliL
MKEDNLRIVNAVLLSLAGAITTLLIIGTIFGLVRSPTSGTLLTFGSNSPQITVTDILQSDDIRIFSGLERIRISLSDSSVMILSLAFPYSASDIAFTEELAAKINDLREIARDYFSSLQQSDLIQIDEDTAKREILRRFNANLRLGVITVLYFSDMLIID